MRLIGCRCKGSDTLSRAVLINHTLSWLVINNHIKGRSGGGYAGNVPPVPISNTEVKFPKADDSGDYSVKVGSRHPSAFLNDKKTKIPFKGIFVLVDNSI